MQTRRKYPCVVEMQEGWEATVLKAGKQYTYPLRVGMEMAMEDCRRHSTSAEITIYSRKRQAAE